MPASKGRPETGRFAAGIVKDPSQLSGLRFPFDLMISFRVAGGGAFPFSPPFSPQRSPPFSPPCSVLPSVICHRPSHPFRVAGGSPRWRVAGFSTQSSIQPSVIDSAQPEAARSARSADPTSRQCPEITKNQERRTKNSLEQPYVVTRSRPYPARRSREVEAVSGWRLGTQPRQTRAARGAAPTSRQALPRYSILHTRYSQATPTPGGRI